MIPVDEQPEQYHYSVIIKWTEENDHLSDQEISRKIIELINDGDYHVTKIEI